MARPLPRERAEDPGTIPGEVAVLDPRGRGGTVPGAAMGKTLSYRELVKEVDQFSRVLVSLGIQRGDRVGLILPNCPQYVIAYYATLRIGAVVVGNNPLYTERELSHQLKDAGIEACVTLDQLYPKVAEVQDEVGLRE